MSMARRAMIVVGAAWALLPAAQAQTLEVSGATTVQKRILEPGAEGFKAATGIELKIYGPGTGKGMLALLEGKVPVAAAGEALVDAIGSAKKAAADAGKTVSIPSNLMYHTVASDDIVVVVHTGNRVKSLTRAQAKAIMTGKIKNWKEVHGADLPIKVVAAAPGQAVRNAVQKGLMDGEEFGPGTADIRTALEQLRVVGSNPGAIGAMSEPVVKESNEKVKAVAGVRVGRPLGFVTVGAPNASAQKLIDFFHSPAGKKLIK
ncbi:MAG: substrate-binding domain-containing protein [Betaproteobacteria bacterium]|nr:substrate-binding domain-containing protein [Betaproteobacteria bacterium]